MLGKNFTDYNITLFILLLGFTVTIGIQLPDILWDPDDPIYNATQCGNKSKLFKVKQGDILNIICSNRDLNNGILTQTRNRRHFHYNIHVTDDVELYTTRRTRIQNGSEATTVHQCKESLHTDSYFQIKTLVENYKVIFSKWGSSKGRIFQEGKTYYFFTTSNGTKGSIENTVAPKSTSHMGFEVYVCRANETCEARERIRRCGGEKKEKKEKEIEPTVVSYEAPKDVGTLKWSKAAISGVVVIVFIAGFVLGILLNRCCEMRRREKESQKTEASCEANEKAYLRAPSCTGTEKTDISGSTNGEFEALHLANV